MDTPIAVIPTARDEDWWQIRHQQKVEQLKVSQPNFNWLFLGDSITHEWEIQGEQHWQQYFGQGHAHNLGFAGDRTEHLLWRLYHSPLHLIRPEWIIVLIGTNNAGHRLDTPEHIAAGVKTIITLLKQRLKHSKIMLMAIFPRSRNNHKPMRKRVNATNQLLEKLAEEQQVFWLNINQKLLTKEGVLLETVMPDLLHPNSQQYAIWAEAIVSLSQNN